jgi:SAM-dependent methyltransferase
MARLDYSIHYRRFHDDTEAHAEAMARWLGTILEPDLPSDRLLPIIDVGCGCGFALRALRLLGYTNLIGLETSAEQAARARQAGFEVVVVENSTAWLLDHPGQFGAIVLLDVLEHVPVPDQIDFATALRVALRSDGKVILTVPNANSPLAARWRYIDYTHHCSFTEHSLHFVLKSAGFESIHFDNRKGIGRMPRRLWLKTERVRFRRWLVRWCWLQVFKAEFSTEHFDEISFELNLHAVATNSRLK